MVQKLLALLNFIQVASSLKVLWIGNSFTYYNDLPSLVSELSQSSGHPYEYDSHLEGGWTWEKHAASQLTMDKIRQDKWDVVVLQEYSSRPAYNEEDVCRQTVPFLDQLVQMILTNNPDTIIQFYLTWGGDWLQGSDLCAEQSQFCSYEPMQDALTIGYLSFTCMKKPARAAPVGEGFRNIKAEYGDETWRQLYWIDNKHPSLAGSYLSALIHYMSLFDLKQVPEDAPDFGLGQEWKTKLVSAAESAMGKQDWEFGADSDCDMVLCQ